MPFYEYECSNCKFYVEALQKISEPALRKCPSCKKQTLQRLVSAPVFRLKGGGWYETDFKSDQEGKRNLAAGEEAPPEAKAADDKEAKPAEAAKETEKKPAAEIKKSESGSRAPAKTRKAKPAVRRPAPSSSKRSSKSKAKSSARKRGR